MRTISTTNTIDRFSRNPELNNKSVKLYECFVFLAAKKAPITASFFAFGMAANSVIRLYTSPCRTGSVRLPNLCGELNS